MEELETHLRHLCASDSRLRLLDAQWEYDKHLVRQALQTVGNTFPHYSRHDGSHSDTLLVNIVRILGPRIERLSATDVWLLLEAAYWHDVGMVVSDESIRSSWNSPDFKAHLDGLLESSDAILSEAAKLLSETGLTEERENEWPLDVRQAVTFVVADYFRKRHPTRSAEAIRFPSGHSIDSPRTLIPARLFDWLAKICSAHGASRDVAEALPYRENGIGRDLCHPRFIAFLLRLGDLLDLDNNRFCKVLLAHVGTIPISSRIHISKHASIEHFYAGPDHVDVVAVCRANKSEPRHSDTYETYQAVTEWLRWLKEELTHLAISWTRIAPPDMGAPPSIGKIEAHLEGYELLPNHDTPAFDIDRDYFLELSKSSGLFGSPQQAWQRELITNAVDATLLRLWLGAADVERNAITEGEDPLRQLYSATDGLPIRITVIPEKKTFGNPPMRRWHVTISDQGCGIGADDLMSLQVVGSSSRNTTRRRLIDSMPEFLRPTGSFGLGFQSVFLDTEEVTITTEHLLSGIRREITATRPFPARSRGLREPAKRAGLYVRQVEKVNVTRRDPGTTLKFTVERPAAFGQMNADPVCVDEHTVSDESWVQELSQICVALPVPVFVNNLKVSSEADEQTFAYFDRKNATRIVFTLDANSPKETTGHAYRGATIQRGQAQGLLLPYVSDLYCGKASDILQVSRTSFTATGSAEHARRCAAALPAAVERYLHHLRSRPDTNKEIVGRVSLAAHATFGLKDGGDEWQALELPIRLESGSNQVPVAIGEFLKQSEVHFLARINSVHRTLKTQVQVPTGTYMLPALGLSELASLIKKSFQEVCHVATVGPIPNEFFHSYLALFVARKTVTHDPPVAIDALESLVLPQFPAPFPMRAWVPCIESLEVLCLNHPSYTEFVDSPMMLSPFTFTCEHGERHVACVENLQEYISFVVKNRKTGIGNAPTRTQVADAIWKFVEHADRVYEKDPMIERRYDLAKIKLALDNAMEA